MALHRPVADAEWPEVVHRALEEEGVSLVAYVPDAELKKLIELCQADPAMNTVPPTTEEEGIGLTIGAWLGGAKAALLLQSSGVGNLVNALGAVAECGMPLFMLVSMRGEDGEQNPWQVPMGRATPSVLAAMGVKVDRVERKVDVEAVVAGALRATFADPSPRAVLLSQKFIGIKSFQEQVDR
jgi:sulfopyruvate decarboxylase alpha subunit